MRAIAFVPGLVPSVHDLFRLSSEMLPMEHRIAAAAPLVMMEKSPLSSQIFKARLVREPWPPAWYPHGPAGPLQPIT